MIQPLAHATPSQVDRYAAWCASAADLARANRNPRLADYLDLSAEQARGAESFYAGMPGTRRAG